VYPGVFVVLIFILVMLLIATETLDHTLSALLGATLAVIFLVEVWPAWTAIVDPPGHVFTYETFAEMMAHWIDYRTIIIILSIMVITETVRDSGLFQFIALQAVKLSKGRPALLLALLCIMAFLLSAVLTQIATMVLIGSLTIAVCDALDLEPAPFLISEAMVSNVGAVSTMISGIPNILIAGATGYGFDWFLLNLAPFAVLLTAISIGVCILLFRHQLTPSDSESIHHLMELDSWTMVPDRIIFYRTAFLLGLLIAGFVIFSQHTYLVAFVGALAFFLLSGLPPERVIKEVEWSAILFFMGLFILVGCMEVFGVFNYLSEATLLFTGGNPLTAHLTILWVTGLSSGMVDNIPITLALIPVVKSLASVGIPADTLWMSLTLGAELGGCLTPISSTANLLAYRLALRERRPIPFRTFLSVGAIITFLYLVSSTVYIVLRLLFLPLTMT